MNTITVNCTIKAPAHKVWECWTNPEHIVGWNFATEDWTCPSAVNELVAGGKFSWRMEARDGSFGFDYAGTYDRIDAPREIQKHLDDGRKVNITFTESDGMTEVTETFEPDENDPELQRQGWQAILNNFKKYVESH